MELADTANTSPPDAFDRAGVEREIKEYLEDRVKNWFLVDLYAEQILDLVLVHFGVPEPA